MEWQAPASAAPAVLSTETTPKAAVTLANGDDAAPTHGAATPSPRAGVPLAETEPRPWPAASDADDGTQCETTNASDADDGAAARAKAEQTPPSNESDGRIASCGACSAALIPDVVRQVPAGGAAR